MSLAKLVAATQVTPKAAQAARILILDVERLPGRATHQHRGLTIEGDFWDLNSWKGTIGYRLPADSVTEWPRTICLAWAWYDRPRDIQFAAEWQEGGHEAAMRAAWDAYDQADIVVGHNVRRADTAWLTSEWAEYRWPKPSPFQQVDTLAIARSQLGMESNTLDALCKRLGIPAKTDKYDVATAKAAVAGDEKAQRKLEKYNRGDIKASIGIYDRLRPFATTHPHLGIWTGDDRACPNCGGDKFVEHDMDVHTAQSRYAARRCARCGTVVRNSHMKARATTRAAR